MQDMKKFFSKTTVVVFCLTLASVHSQAQSSQPDCPPKTKWDPDMNMCMPDDSGNQASQTSVIFHGYQYLDLAHTSGDRGATRVTGPGMWMLMLGRALTPRNTVSVNIMGEDEKDTVGKKGTPQLFQDDHIDNMHAHDRLMALNFEDVMSLGKDGERKIILDFSPRGEASVGPHVFMHRDTAFEAPIAHGIQDGSHDAWSVYVVKYQTPRSLTEASAFSGKDEATLSHLPKPDSYSIRANYRLNDNVSIGGSAAKVLLEDDNGVSLHNQFLSAWLETKHLIKGHELKSTTIWSQVRNKSQPSVLNSFLEEFLYQVGKNGFYGRIEILQRTPEDLKIVVTDGATGAQWVKAITSGYERSVYSRSQYGLSAGGKVTKDIAPKAFQTAYGHGSLYGAAVYIRLKWLVHN